MLSIWCWFGKFKISNWDGEQGWLLQFTASWSAQNKPSHCTWNCKAVSSLNPPAILLLLAHSAPVTSYSSNIPGLLPSQDPCSFCSLFPECSFPRNLHWRLLDLLQAFAQMSSANEVFPHPVWNKIAHSPPTSDIPYTPPLHILTTFFFLHTSVIASFFFLLEVA